MNSSVNWGRHNRIKNKRAGRLTAHRHYAKAEPLLRECLKIRETKLPDDWRTQSLFNGSLLGLKNYADAEPLLLSGYDGMNEREAKIPPKASGA